MKAEFKREMVDGRCYFNDGVKHVLVDTGYGSSISADGRIGQFAALKREEQGIQCFNPTIMRNGRKIGAIMYPLDFNGVFLKKDTVEIDDAIQELPEHDWFIPFIGDLPVLKCKVDGRDKTAYFDSGMRLSVFDDDSLVEGKEMLRWQPEWIGVLHGLAEAPVYNAKFEFPCGLEVEREMEHDYIHQYIKMIFARTAVNGYVGLETFKGYDIFISGIPGKRGLALVER